MRKVTITLLGKRLIARLDSLNWTIIHDEISKSITVTPPLGSGLVLKIDNKKKVRFGINCYITGYNNGAGFIRWQPKKS